MSSCGINDGTLFLSHYCMCCEISKLLANSLSERSNERTKMQWQPVSKPHSQHTLPNGYFDKPPCWMCHCVGDIVCSWVFQDGGAKLNWSINKHQVNKHSSYHHECTVIMWILSLGSAFPHTIRYKWLMLRISIFIGTQPIYPFTPTLCKGKHTNIQSSNLLRGRVCLA